MEYCGIGPMAPIVAMAMGTTDNVVPTTTTIVIATAFVRACMILCACMRHVCGL